MQNSFAIQDVHYVLDSAAWPPLNPQRPTLEAYAAEIMMSRQLSLAGTGATLDWVAPYDHLLDPVRTAADARRLECILPWHVHDEYVVNIVQFPHGSADDVIGLLLDDLDMLDDEERESLALAKLSGAVDGPVGRPACAVGNLVPQRYSNVAAEWYARLLTDLSAAVDLDEACRRIHLFGIGRPTWVNHPLVHSFDTSGPYQQAGFGWQNIAPCFNPTYGYTQAKLQYSREARVAYWVTDYRARCGLPWQPIDEQTLLDDRPRRGRVRDVNPWYQVDFLNQQHDPQKAKDTLLLAQECVKELAGPAVKPAQLLQTTPLGQVQPARPVIQRMLTFQNKD